MHRFLLIAVLLLSLVPAAYADLDGAHSAYEKGNYSQAFSMYKEYAEQGDVDAQYALGVLYYDGKGVNQDIQQAAKWITMAAEKGVTKAQLFLGNLCFDGEGMKQDYEEAAKWYLLAAKKGNVDAQFNMGLIYEYGLGVEIVCDRAEEWYNKAANQGDEEAQEILEYFTCREYANVASLKTYQ